MTNPTTAEEPKRIMRRLLIGGSSGLARTYMNAHGAASEGDWILLGHDSTAPHWIINNNASEFF
jgi:hypothetical protein